MENKENYANSSFSFFYNNLSVTGFYEENALFMTMKELFDNSIDALSKLKDDKEIKQKTNKKIELILREYNQDLSYYEIICKDNGIGVQIQDLENFGEMFLTSKQKTKTSGKFGIGLKTILLYSYKTAYGFLHIKIKINQNKIWDFILVIDKNLNHTFVQNFKEYLADNYEWSVEISVILKINNKYIFDKKILFYIKLSLLWYKDIYVKCHYLQDIFEYNLNNCNVFDLIINDSNNMFIKNEELNSYNFNLNITINVRYSNKIICNLENMNIGIAFLIRYVNFMPLLGNNTNCTLTTDFKNFLKIYGAQFGIEPLSTENINEEFIDNIINLDFYKDLKNIFDTFYLKKSEKSQWNIIIIGIDVNSSDISFANLNKNCIKEGEYLSNLINKCLLNIFNNIKKDFPDEFESLTDYQLRQTLDLYGNQLAVSLSKIILKGRDEFKNKIFYLLNEKKLDKDLEISEKKKINSIQDINEKELTEIFFNHIKNKVLSLNNEKVKDNKNDISEKSSISDYEDEDEDGGEIDE